MFVANTEHQTDFLEIWSKQLSPKKLELLKLSKGYQFYKIIFCHIKEEDFRCLYSPNWSAPNSSVNCLVSSMILCHQRNWSHEELERQICFNVEIRVALGLKDLESAPFSMRTFYNFKNRLSAHEQQTGENLIEKVFEHLTKKQLASLNLNTTIQRGDSVLLESSIRTYSRLALLVEVLRRLYLILSPKDQEAYHFLFQPYIKGGEKFVYTLKPAERPNQMEALARVYYSLDKLLKERYGEHPVFQIFERVYHEHFKAQQTKEEDENQSSINVELRSTEELGSSTLQSPDDIDATFRSKRKEPHHGFVAFGAETCHPENEINLVTALSVDTNNTDDSTLLENKIDDIIELTPQIEEFHQDGGFGSTTIDEKAKVHKITIIQTAVRGKNAAVPMSIEGDEKKGFTVECPNPEQPIVKATKTKKSNKAVFDLGICNTCPLRDSCPAYKTQNTKKGFASFYFPDQAALMQKRHKAIQTIPKKRRALRSGVEGLMAQMHRGAKHTGKLKVRGLFNCQLYVFFMGIAINFDRIFKWLFPKNATFLLFFAFFALSPLTKHLSTKISSLRIIKLFQ